MNGARRALAFAALTLALFGALFLPDLRDGRIFAFRDVANYHLPIGRVVSSELREGRLPFWNPYIACGTPLAANPNNYALYPGRLSDLFLSPEAAITVHLLGHWVAGGVAFGFLATIIGISPFGATGAVAAYLLAGPTLSLLNFANLAPFLLWIPLTAIAWIALLHRPDARRCFGLAVCVAVQATFAEPAFLFMEILILFALPNLGGERTNIAFSRSALWIAVALFLALLLAAPAWMSTLDLVSQSARAGDVQADVGASMDPRALGQVAVPQLFGDYHTLEKRTYWGEMFHEGRGPFFLSLSFGMVVLTLALVGVSGKGRAALPLLVIAVIAVLLATGARFSPLRALFFNEALRWFRWPVKLTFVTAFALPLLAGFGFDALRADAVRQKKAIFAGVVLALGLAVVALVGAIQFSGDALAPASSVKDVETITAEVRTRLFRSAAFAGSIALLGGLVLSVRRAAFSSLAPALTLALLLLELVGPQRHVNRGTPLEALTRQTPILEQARAMSESGYRVYFPTHHWEAQLPRLSGFPDEWWPRVVLDREIGNFYHAMGEGIRTVLVNPDRLIDAGAAERARIALLLSSADREQLLQLIGVRGTTVLGHLARRTQRTPYATIAGYPAALTEDPEAIPIAHWLASLPELADERPWSGPFVRRAREHIRENGTRADILIQVARPGEWVLESKSEEAGFVCITESREPGWSVSVEGRREPIVSYLGDFMAVGVGAGEHRIEWRYRPPQFGLAIACLVLGIAAAASLLLLRGGSPEKGTRLPERSA